MARAITTRFAGLLILVGGLWGGVIPFVGPYFHFTLGPDHAWTWTSGRLYLDVLPGLAAVVGGLLLLIGGRWMVGRLGALLAVAGGIWFAVGPDISGLWHIGGAQGAANGSRSVQILERLSFHTGLGALIAVLAAYALPPLVAIRRRVPARTAAREAARTPATTGAGPGAVAGPAAVAGAGAAIGASRRRTRLPPLTGSGRPTAV